MLDYRNHLKRILQKTSGDDQSLKNGLTAIKAIIQMADDGQESTPIKTKKPSISDQNEQNKDIKRLLTGITQLIKTPGDPAAKKQALTALHKLTFVPGVAKILALKLEHWIKLFSIRFKQKKQSMPKFLKRQ